LVGADAHVRILDFGIGCLLAETEGESLVDTMSTANAVNSGLDCASPESIMDPTNLTPLGDQYSLGCILYYFLTGQYPFPDGTAVEKMMSHQHKQPKPIRELNAEVPEGPVAVVDRLMKKSPSERYADCGELLSELRPFAGASAAPMRRTTMAMPRARLAPPESTRPSPAAPPVAPSAPRPRAAQPPLPRPASLVEKLPRSEHGQKPALAAAAPPTSETTSPPALSVAENRTLVLSSQQEPSEQRIGNLGIVLLAVLAGIAAYFLSALVNIKL
jgi:serine/threonine-protein kinase